MAAHRVTGCLIKLFITDDDPRSLRTRQLLRHGRDGPALLLQKVLAREELSSSCIYLLIQSVGSEDLPTVYVGESEDVGQRYATSPFPIPFDGFVGCIN